MSMIERVFRGSYHPCDTIKPDSEEFRLAEAEAFKMSTRLEDSLSEEQKAMWEAFLDNNTVSNELYALEYYRHGVIFGARLMAEILGRETPPTARKGGPH